MSTETKNQSWPPFQGIEISAFPISCGPLASMGRHVKITFPNWIANFKQDPKTKERKLVSTTVNLSDNICDGPLDGERKISGFMSGDDKLAVQARVRNEVLEVHRFPTTTFRPTHEDDLFLRGLLELHGEQHEITCTKTTTRDDLQVKCPLDTRVFKIPQHQTMMGMLRIDFVLDVVVTIPAQTLKSQGKWFDGKMPNVS